MRMRHIVICGLSGSTKFLNIIPKNGTIFGKKVIEHKMCVLIFFTIFVRNISYSKKNWAKYDKKCTKYFRYDARHSCRISKNFSRQIFKMYSNSTKIRTVGAEMFHADRQTMSKLISRLFANFAEAPTKTYQDSWPQNFNPRPSGYEATLAVSSPWRSVKINQFFFFCWIISFLSKDQRMKTGSPNKCF